MKQTEEMANNSNQTRDLVLSLLFDAIGMMSLSIPLIGDFSDVIWAPLSGLIMVWIYKGTMGKVAGVVSFIEEILPVTDIIPSFTLMWFYTYIIKKS